MKMELISENTVMVYFDNNITAENSQRVVQSLYTLQSRLGDYILDAVPSYHSILITVDILKMDMKTFLQQSESLLNQPHRISLHPNQSVIEVPTYYGKEVAWDADAICFEKGLTWQQMIQLHSQKTYRVYAIGFAPGFAYLGNVDKRIQVPRKTTPRAVVPKGSVAIAEQQTAVYPKASPGGWSIIGRTPIELVDFAQDNLTLFHIGAEVHFKPISRDTYLEMGGVLEMKEEQE